MQIDIIPITEQEMSALGTVEKKLVRTAQQKKNELAHKLEQEKETFKLMLMANNVYQSSLYSGKCDSLDAEYEYQVEILREQLLFNLSLKEPTHDEETGGSQIEAAYIVDYELSYIERYIIVRDYYMTISDPDERLALLESDDVAKDYLSSYYAALVNYLSSFV